MPVSCRLQAILVPIVTREVDHGVDVIDNKILIPSATPRPARHAAAAADRAREDERRLRAGILTA